MKKLIFTSLAFITLAHFAFAQIPDCSDLFISEYLEGTGKNRVLEIYNPTFEDIDLSEYSVKVFASGPNNPNVMQLSGTLSAKEVFVCGHDQADSGILLLCDITSSELKFDGDDAVGLYKNDVLIDMIGEIGVNPGNTGWQVGIGFTKDNTLRRGIDVRGPTAYWTQSQFEWDVLPIDDIGGLGDNDNICTVAAKGWFSKSGANLLGLNTTVVGNNVLSTTVEEGESVQLPIAVANNSNVSIQGLVWHNPNIDCEALTEDPPSATFGTDYFVSLPVINNDQIKITVQDNAGVNVQMLPPLVITIEDDTEFEGTELICFRIIEHTSYPNFLLGDDPNQGRYQFFEIVVLDNDLPAGIEERMEKTFKVYPTVANEELFVETKKYEGQMEIMIYNVFGQEMKRQTISQIKARVEIGNLANGMYVLQAIGDGWKVDRLFIKN